MNKRPFFRVIILVLLFLSACAAPGTSADGFLKVSLKDLFANPQIYNGKELCTDGIYLKAFEVSALADSYEIKDNYRSLVGPNIWVEHPAMETFECVEESDRFGKFCMVVVAVSLNMAGSTDIWVVINTCSVRSNLSADVSCTSRRQGRQCRL
jgi:hypothetical protein